MMKTLSIIHACQLSTAPFLVMREGADVTYKLSQRGIYMYIVEGSKEGPMISIDYICYS